VEVEITNPKRFFNSGSKESVETGTVKRGKIETEIRSALYYIGQNQGILFAVDDGSIRLTSSLRWLVF
jgi:hypothetical protein